MKINRKTEEEKLVLYKVENGDTLWAIAKRFEGMTIEKLRALNNLKSKKNLSPNDERFLKWNLKYLIPIGDRLRPKLYPRHCRYTFRSF